MQFTRSYHLTLTTSTSTSDVLFMDSTGFRKPTHPELFVVETGQEAFSSSLKAVRVSLGALRRLLAETQRRPCSHSNPVNVFVTSGQ